MQSHQPVDHDAIFEIQVNVDPINWLAAAGMVILVTILILLNRSLVISIRKFRPKNALKIALSSIVATISFATAAITCLITTIFILISNDFYHRTVVCDIFSKASICFYTLSQTLMIYVFIRRIDIAFSGSVIQYPPCVIRSLYFASIVFLIFCFCMTVALTFELMNYFMLLMFTWMTLFLCVSIILCTLFIRKANLLLESSASLSSAKVVDKDFLYIIIKQSILVPIAICTSFTCFIMVLLVQYLRASTEWIPAAIFWIVVDCTVSSISIFLLFSWNNHIYDKYCYWFHRCCENKKMSRLEISLSDVKKSSSGSKNSKLDVHDVVEAAYSGKKQTSGCDSTTTSTSTGTNSKSSTDNKKLLSAPGTDPAYAMQPIVVPKVTRMRSLKRMVSKEKLQDKCLIGSQHVVQSAPVQSVTHSYSICKHKTRVPAMKSCNW